MIEQATVPRTGDPEFVEWAKFQLGGRGAHLGPARFATAWLLLRNLWTKNPQYRQSWRETKRIMTDLRAYTPQHRKAA